MNCTVYTVMEGHGNTTDNRNNNQNFKQGLLFSRSFKNKNNVCDPVRRRNFYRIAKTPTTLHTSFWPRDYMNHGTGFPSSSNLLVFLIRALFVHVSRPKPNTPGEEEAKIIASV